MTSILQVITEYCSLYVDDIRLSDLAATDAPLYARRMYQYLKPTISLFTVPTEMQEHLLGTLQNPKFVEPKFDSTLYEVTQDYNTTFEISLGTEFVGYEMCACRVKTEDNTGEIILTPISIDYNSETGAVSVNATIDNPIESGAILDFDFYTDGYFTETLTPAIMNILGMCFQVVWLEGFTTEWLSMVSKVEDDSFYEQNRANNKRADAEKLRLARQQLAGEMRRYEQNMYKKAFVRNPVRI